MPTETSYNIVCWLLSSTVHYSLFQMSAHFTCQPVAHIKLFTSSRHLNQFVAHISLFLTSYFCAHHTVSCTVSLLLISVCCSHDVIAHAIMLFTPSCSACLSHQPVTSLCYSYQLVMSNCCSQHLVSCISLLLT